MAELDRARPAEAKPGAAQSESRGSPYCTFPVTTTHGPRDKSAYHGREDSRRMVAVRRIFPGRGKA